MTVAQVKSTVLGGGPAAPEQPPELPAGCLPLPTAPPPSLPLPPFPFVSLSISCLLSFFSTSFHSFFFPFLCLINSYWFYDLRTTKEGSKVCWESSEKRDFWQLEAWEKFSGENLWCRTWNLSGLCVCGKERKNILSGWEVGSIMETWHPSSNIWILLGCMLSLQVFLFFF